MWSFHYAPVILFFSPTVVIKYNVNFCNFRLAVSENALNTYIIKTLMK